VESSLWIEAAPLTGTHEGLAPPMKSLEMTANRVSLPGIDPTVIDD